MRPAMVTTASAVAALLLLLAARVAHVDARDPGSDASTLRDLVPRYNSNAEFAPSDPNYQMSIVVIAAVPVGLAALTFLAAFLFCMCRCCAMLGLCKCCVRPPRDEGYSKRARIVPWVFLMLFGALVTAMSSYGLSENDKLSRTMTAPAGSGSSFVNFIPRVFSGVNSKLDEIQAPLMEIVAGLRPAANNAVTVMNNSVGTISSGTTQLTDALRNFNTTWNGYVLVTALGNFSCTYCTTVGTLLGQTAAEIDNQTSGFVADLRSTVDSVNGTLVSEIDNIEPKVVDVNTTINTHRTDVANAEKSSRDIVDNINTYDPKRHLVTVILYAVPLGGMALVLLGTIFKLSPLFKVNVWLFFLVTFVMWLLLGIYLPVAVVLGDACVYADKEEAAVQTKTDDTSRVITSCLTNTSVLTAMNVTNQLDFASNITFPALPNVTEIFNFSALTQLNSEISALNISTFGWNDTALTAPVDNFNSFSGRSYPYANFTTYDPLVEFPGDPTSQTAMTNAQQAVVDANSTKNAMVAALASMAADTQGLVDTKDNVTQQFVVAAQDVDSLRNITSPFIALANQLIDVANCHFAADLYHELRDLTCVGIVGHFSVMAMTCFFIAFSGWFIIVLSQISASRVPRPYNPDFDEGTSDAKASGGVPSKGTVVEMQHVQVRPKSSASVAAGSAPSYAYASSRAQDPRRPSYANH